MNKGVSLFAVGHATSLLLAISFTLCVVFDLLFPGYAMYQSWQALVPGFVWLSWKSFFIGLIEAWAYGWYFALIWVPIYNFVAQKGEKCSKHTDSVWGS
ncbi:MAG: DUF5676 family membrane protein [Gammaproteobacteria bacterium]|nr:DUF5676 family membrane protein [Gammaproteobacteria bacterium]